MNTNEHEEGQFTRRRGGAEKLVCTSVDDARSSIKCWESNGHLDIATIEEALRYLLDKFPEQKTRRKLFEATIKRWNKLKAAK